ncbi:MAG: hypothetical protein WD749_06765 [Phycisphaerales bacterium]
MVTRAPAPRRLSPKQRRARAAAGVRRGVVSVLSMMFLILFGSLAAAMAITSRSNIITAATHQHVSRSLGAAETGLEIARARLTEAATRFVVAKGVVDSGFGQRLWRGTTNPSDGQVSVQPPTSYVNSQGTPSGLAEAVAQIHAMDNNTVVVAGISAPTIAPAPSGADPAVYDLTHWVRTPAVALNPQQAGVKSGTAFQIDYAPLASGTDIRVIVTGYDFDYTTRTTAASAGTPTYVTRRIMQDFTIVKRVNSAIVSPSKVMIGKNVLVEGDLGAAYTDVAQQYGDPVIMRSDFWGLETGLNTQLTRLFDALRDNDIDDDNRLRLGHPIEGAAVPDFSNLGYPGTSSDVTADGYLDEFDIFMMYYDQNRDGKVALSSPLSAGTPNAALSPEFVASGGLVIDDDLALLLDSANPDRNRNGIYSFTDANGNGVFDPGIDTLADTEEVDPSGVPAHLQTYIITAGGTSYVYRDQVLGFRDGVLDRRDSYAKVRGRIIIRVSDSTWTAAQGTWMNRVRGSIQAPTGSSSLQLNTPTSQLPDLDMHSFDTTETALQNAANGQTFAQQVATSLGVSVAQLATWTPANNPPEPAAPKYFPLAPDADNDGLPDNWETAHFEKMPFSSPNYYDFYYRPVYENMVFKNVQIPEGNNGLFRSCTFVGVTFIRSRTGNTHPNWGLYGKMMLDNTNRPKPFPSRFVYTGSFPPDFPGVTPPVMMATTPLDKADIPADEAPITQGYDTLPDPLVIDGARVVDTKRFSNNIRFHDCLFVGSTVTENPITYTQTRNKVQFTGGTRFTTKHPTEPDNPNLNPSPEHLPEIAKSSMMLPNYSVDIGSYNSPPSQNVKLKGAIVAGVLDIRGNADLEGSLLLTFKPVLGEAPLLDVMGVPAGNPAMFNSTIGYFGPEDGDDEALDPDTLPVVNGVRIVGWDTDGDGIADLGPGASPPAGAVAVPFHGFGRITLRFDPTMKLPDGILLPLQIDSRRETYKEASQ